MGRRRNSTLADGVLDLGWANQSALGVVCALCGYVHEFVGDAVETWALSGGYPTVD